MTRSSPKRRFRLRRALPWLLGPLGLAACGHAESATRPDAPPTHPKPAVSKSEQPTPPVEQIEDYMADHFVIVTYSRDAVINGDLEALREPLQVFADHQYKPVAPGAWMPWIAQIQQVARLTSEATTFEAAAGGVASMGRSCGGCHEASFGGLNFDSSVRETVTPPSDTLEERMGRHMWAADRLWEGLVGPSDESWAAGASALAHTPDRAPVTDPPLPPQFVSALRATRALAEDALDATTLERRADVYGFLLATCADCHAYGVEYDF